MKSDTFELSNPSLLDSFTPEPRTLDANMSLQRLAGLAATARDDNEEKVHATNGKSKRRIKKALLDKCCDCQRRLGLRSALLRCFQSVSLNRS
jgi:hypothetical protein